jgi:hypothetical protein
MIALIYVIRLVDDLIPLQREKSTSSSCIWEAVHSRQESIFPKVSKKIINHYVCGG